MKDDFQDGYFNQRGGAERRPSANRRARNTAREPEAVEGPLVCEESENRANGHISEAEAPNGCCLIDTLICQTHLFLFTHSRDKTATFEITGGPM